MTQLLEAIRQQHNNLTQLIEILDKELYLISTRNAEALIALLHDKEQLLDGVQQQDAVVLSLHAEAKKNNQLDDELQQQLDAARELVEQCKYRTEINAKAVEQGQLKLEHLRNLFVELRSKETMTYDKTGKTQSATLGKGFSA